MDATHSNAAAKAPIPPRGESKAPGQLAGEIHGNVQSGLPVSVAGFTTGDPGSTPRLGYGLPCAKCHLYYPARMSACPWCRCEERVSPSVELSRQQPVAAAPTGVNAAALEQEREAFLQQFKLKAGDVAGEIAKEPAECALSRQHPENPEPASVCRSCYELLQHRVDVLGAALHIDLKEAAQIVYQAVWADPSDPAKTYMNAAAALLTELRKRAGFSSVLAPVQHRGN
jgi:hypothetical protein